MTGIFDKLFNGIKAAVLLIGIVILLGIVANTPAWRGFFHARQWTYTGIHETFAAVILFGLLLGWCFPTKVKKYCPVIIVAPSVFLLLATVLYLAIGEHEPTPREIKLADCSGSILNIHLNAPRGRHYVLFLNGLPMGYMTNGSFISSYKFTGRLSITTSKSQATVVPLNSDKMFASPGELDLGPVNLEGGESYDLKIEFDPSPPPSSFVSLYWMQSYSDRNK